MLKRTPLYESQSSLGAKMVDFSGWEMAVQFAGPIEEHMAVRQAAGLFDVSHMGEIEVQGPDALRFLQGVTTNDVSALKDNQAQYSMLTNPSGGVIDDLLVYRLNAQYFLLVVNAGTTDKDFSWMKQQGQGLNAQVHDTSRGHSLLAIQGPNSERILQDLCDHMLDRIPYYWSQQVHIDGLECRVSRTGYTGEDGFEIFCAPSDAKHLWNRLLVTGRPLGLAPCGLAARNTLRLEAGLRLYGHDMDDTTTPVEAGLGWAVKLAKGDFVGRLAIEKQKKEGVQRKLIGFEVEDRAPARDGYPVSIGGEEVSRVSSGSPAPYLKKNIGFAYLPVRYTAPGTEIAVVVRKGPVPARVVPTPFYKRDKRFD
ncbi:MAG TPA: glycine cleavage system aminomethyltransferase GcvT [Blastocatellia bacterium]|nr:glycine cleavage system aminomethyltransferase GcvT [Blastocatellia bacterium]